MANKTNYKGKIHIIIMAKNSVLIEFVDRTTTTEKSVIEKDLLKMDKKSGFLETPQGFLCKIQTLMIEKNKIKTITNNILISPKKIYCMSISRDNLFINILEKNASKAHKPELFIIEILEDYIQELYSLQEQIEKDIDILENKIVEGKTKKTLPKIFITKKKVMQLRKINKSYLRLVGSISRKNKSLYREALPLYEEILHFDEMTDTYRELLSNIIDAHLSIISNKMNQIMKVLTIIATIAMPLTVISSIYGMNIGLPLQTQSNAFLFVIGLMVLIAIIMLIMFAKLGWIIEKD